MIGRYDLRREVNINIQKIFSTCRILNLESMRYCRGKSERDFFLFSIFVLFLTLFKHMPNFHIYTDRKNKKKKMEAVYVETLQTDCVHTCSYVLTHFSLNV